MFKQCLQILGKMKSKTLRGKEKLIQKLFIQYHCYQRGGCKRKFCPPELLVIHSNLPQ